MNFLKRLIVKPREQVQLWNEVDANPEKVWTVLLHQAFPLILLGGMASYFFNHLQLAAGDGKAAEGSLQIAVHHVVSRLVSLFASAYAIDLMAPYFSAERNFGKSMQLVAYSSVYAWIGDILDLTGVFIINPLFIIFSLQLFSRGFEVLMGREEEKSSQRPILSLFVYMGFYLAVPILIRWIMGAWLGIPIVKRWSD